MPYRKDELPTVLLPHLRIRAVLFEVGKSERTVIRSLPPIIEETVTFSLPHIAAHIEIKDYDYYHIKAEVQSTRSGSLSYDGRVVRIGEDGPFCAMFSYPSEDAPIEEIQLTLWVVRTVGGAPTDSCKAPMNQGKEENNA